MIVLLGAPGAGKSTLGPRLARALLLPFVDLDDAIVERAGQRVADLVAAEGWEGFRRHERVALEDALHRFDGPVVSAGAGVVETAAARAVLADAGCLAVHLGVPVDVAAQRLAHDDSAASGRPWLPETRQAADIATAIAAREGDRAAHRAAVAAVRVDANADVDTVLLRVLAALQERGVVARAPALVSTGSPLRLPRGLGTVRSGDVGELSALSDDDAVVVDAGCVAALKEVGVKVLSSWLVVPPGDKSFAAVERVIVYLAARRSPRPAVAVGGGALLDVVGLAAALYRRGSPWRAVPTTVLAAVDAAVGGKTAVDLAGVRNGAGAFHAPVDVLVDHTLVLKNPPALLREGVVEALKHTFLQADAPPDGSADGRDVGLADVVAGADTPAARAALWRAVAFKAGVVAHDPREQTGLRTVLNLGHTLAHALEASVPGLSHGDAVRVGLLFAIAQSVARAGLDAAVADRLAARVRATGPVASGASGASREPQRFSRALAGDKKGQGDQARLVLLRAPGRPVLVDVPVREVEVAATAFLSSLPEAARP